MTTSIVALRTAALQSKLVELKAQLQEALAREVLVEGQLVRAILLLLSALLWLVNVLVRMALLSSASLLVLASMLATTICRSARLLPMLKVCRATRLPN